MLHKGTEYLTISLYYKSIMCIRPDHIIDDVHPSIYVSIYLYTVYSFITFEKKSLHFELVKHLPFLKRFP